MARLCARAIVVLGRRRGRNNRGNGWGVQKDLFDRKLESWKNGSMKTTIDLPADLVKQMKLRAVNEGRKLKDVASEVFRRGMERSEGLACKGERREIKLPLFESGSKAPAPASKMSTRELLELEQQTQMEEDLKRVGGSL